MTAVLSRVQQIAADLFQLPVQKISAASSPETISSWDSVQQLNLILAIEQEFSVQFDPAELDQIYSIGDIVSRLEAKKPA